MATIVPPGGFAGFAQQTPAVQALMRKKTTRKKRKKKKVTKKKRARAQGVGARGKASQRTRTAAGKGRLVKGSKAAKDRMAKIRKMRKK